MKNMPTLKLLIKIGLFTLILILGTTLALLTGEVSSQAWVDLSEVPVQTITTAAAGKVLVAGAASGSEASGVYRSSDFGRTWQAIDPNLNTTVSALITAPGNEAVLYAGGLGGPLATTENLWRSEDGGQTWQKFNLNLPAGPDQALPAITALAVDPRQPELLYVGAGEQGVYRFEVDGRGFELVGGTLPANGPVTSLAVGAKSQLYALAGGDIFANTGDTWQKLAALPDFALNMLVLPDRPQTIYAGSASSGLYRSRDDGQSWENVSDDLELMPGAALRLTALAVDAQDPDHLAVATAYGLGKQIAPGNLYQSHNGGISWLKVAALDRQVTTLTISDGVIHAATTDGLRHYGQVRHPLTKTSSTMPPGSLSSLTHPTGIQILILLLTITLASLVFLMPADWVLHRSR